MAESLASCVRGLVESGAADLVAGRPFVALVTLDSGARHGLVLDEAGRCRWAQALYDELTSFEEGSERHFVEALEMKRSDYDALLEAGAAERALPPLEAALAFPAVDLVRAMLRSGSAHFTRLGLSWLLPSELRELRTDIERVADDRSLPETVRALARRLVVPGGAVDVDPP